MEVKISEILNGFQYSGLKNNDFIATGFYLDGFKDAI